MMNLIVLTDLLQDDTSQSNHCKLKIVKCIIQKKKNQTYVIRSGNIRIDVDRLTFKTQTIDGSVVTVLARRSA